MILIFGCAGFVGLRIFRSLAFENKANRPLCRNVTTVKNNLIADSADNKALNIACSGVECVFHCAGYPYAFSSLTGDDSAKLLSPGDRHHGG